MQVYDNRRAVDYLLTRREVDDKHIGITGASGGGNQTMYAGALDERITAVVPVCSVGNYQAYLKAACCVCEVLPAALRFTEEGDVLGLVAPRALLVINASRDAYQFSPDEAKKSLARATGVFSLYGAPEKVKHQVFESAHDYSKPMREAMYGWMTRWLKGKGDGEPINEPEMTVEQPGDLAALPVDARPAGMLFPPSFAKREGAALVARASSSARHDHREAWEASAVVLRAKFREVMGEMPKPVRPVVQTGRPQTNNGVTTVPVTLTGEAGLPIPMRLRAKQEALAMGPPCLLLHPEGKEAALADPVAAALVKGGWMVTAPDLRAVGETKPKGDTGRGAPDHNSAEHGVWVGRPLFGQWVFDAECVSDWLVKQGNPAKKYAVVGLGQAGLLALALSAFAPERFTAVATVGTSASLLTDEAYIDGTRMGYLVPGFFKAGDVAHLAALSAPRRLFFLDGVSSQGKKLRDGAVKEALAFTLEVYAALKAEKQLTVVRDMPPDDLAAGL
jgi:dienelactone hydrolase